MKKNLFVKIILVFAVALSVCLPYTGLSTEAATSNESPKVNLASKTKDNFATKVLKSAKNDELYSTDDFIIGIYKEKIWLGYQSFTSGDEVFHNGKLSKINKNKATISFTYIDGTKGTGTIALSKNVLILKYKDNGQMYTVKFPTSKKVQEKIIKSKIEAIHSIFGS